MTKCLVALILMTLALAPCASAETFSLNAWGFNVNGTHYDSEPGSPALPSNFDTSGFDFATGLGTITMTFGAPGSYTVLSFFDLDGLPWDNDLGEKTGTPPPEVSWEIGQPGVIVNDFWFGPLLNQNLIGGNHRDVALAFGLNFNVVSENAVAHLSLSPNVPLGFYLNQTGSQGEQAYLTGNVEFGTAPVPEPGTLILLGSGLFSLAGLRRRQ